MTTAVHENPATDGSSFGRVCEAFADHITAHSGAHQAYARCPAPAHGGDTNPSLSITWKVNRKGGGQTFVKCQRECSDRRDILAAVGLAPADCYDTPPVGQGSGNVSRPRPEKPRAPKPKSAPKSDRKVKWGRLRATHTYTDAQGKPLYDVRRWDGGDIKMAARMCDPETGKPIRGSGLPPREDRVLYNLPRVVAAVEAGETIYLPEGESDADAATAAGLVATCNFGGAADTESRAASVWLPQYVEALTGAHVVIVADIDPLEQGRSGYRHALTVLDSLDGVAASVRVTEPPAPKDLRDHLEKRGGTVEDLVTLTREDLVERIAEADAYAAEHSPSAGSAVPEEAPEGDGTAEPERGGEVVDLDSRRGGGGSGGSGGGSGSGSGGGTGDRGPRTITKLLRDEFIARPDGLFKVKRQYGETESGEKIVTELLSELLPTRVRLASQVREDLHDGARPTVTHYDLVADNGEGEEFRLDAVPTDEWKSCAWVAELPAWGARRFNDTPGGRSTLRNAIETTSGAVPVTTLHGVLGWAEIEGEWVYLHAGGGIGARGTLPGVRVQVPPELRAFALPEAPATVEGLRDAVLSSVAFLDVAPARIAAPLLGAAYRAPLGYSRCTVMPVGPKSAMKTSAAALVSQHAAPTARHDRMPGLGAGEETGATATAMEEIRFRAGDTLLPLDDLAPDRGTERASQRCAVIARSQFNRQGKSRGKREGGTREPRPPRSMPLVTGEESTTVESAESRIVLVKFARGDLSKGDMAALDLGEEPMNRARLTAALVRHYAPMKGDLDEGWLRTTRSTLADAFADPAAEDQGLDARHSESIADLATGWRAMLDMATKRGALTEAEAAKLWARAYEGLAECKRLNADRAAGRTAADRVRDLLRTLLAQRRVNLRALDDMSAPEGIETACGWEPDPFGRSDEPPSWRSGGDWLGWTDGVKVWLSPGAATAALTSQAHREHDPLTYTKTGLGDALASQGVIRTQKTKSGTKCSVSAPRIGSQGARPRVWEFTWEWLMGDGEIDPDDDGTPAAPPPTPAPEPEPTPAAPPAPAEPAEPVEVAPAAPTDCRVCGEPLPAVALAEGHDTHASCDNPLGPEPVADAPDTTPAPESVREPVAIEDVPLPEPANEPEPVAPTSDTSPSAGAPRQGRGRRTSSRRRAERGAALGVEPSEVREAQTWAESAEGYDSLTEAQAAAVVERFHEVTGCRWKGPHGTIWALLAGHTKWPGAKAPEPCDLGLFEELRADDRFWTARSWMLAPGEVAEGSTVQGVDVNAQYVAAAGSVEVGEGDALHYEPGEPLPANVLKMPGWVRLGSAVEDAPHGLDLPAGMWVPTPLAVYLTRDHGLALDMAEALVWERKRKALANLAGHFRDWSKVLKAADDGDRASGYALGLVKTLYTKGFGGYLSSEKGLTPPEWHRPDWALLMKAQAEANMLRALDRLPEGCTARAKYADAAFIEVAEGADLAEWHRTTAKGERESYLDPIQPGKFKTMGAARPGPAFRGIKPKADAWRAAYAADPEVSGDAAPVE